MQGWASLPVLWLFFPTTLLPISLANPQNRGSWFAMTYAGELASTAFGANSAGVAYTLNALYPKVGLSRAVAHQQLRLCIDRCSERWRMEGKQPPLVTVSLHAPVKQVSSAHALSVHS